MSRLCGCVSPGHEHTWADSSPARRWVELQHKLTGADRASSAGSPLPPVTSQGGTGSVDDAQNAAAPG